MRKKALNFKVTKLFPCSKESSKSWESRNMKAHRLRGELEDKMESWRRQVIAVQSVSIREAEAKAREVMEQVIRNNVIPHCQSDLESLINREGKEQRNL